MQALLADFHFLRPAWLLLFVPLAWLAWRLARHVGSAAAWQQVCDAALVPFVVSTPAVRRRGAGIGAFSLGGVLAVFALAGPTWQREPQPVFRDQAALVILLDLSQSMTSTDVTPSRLGRAKFKIKDLLASRTTGQTALIAFAAQPFTVTPLTDDVRTIDSQLAVLAPELMPRQGSDVPRALRQGVALLRQAGFPQGDLLLVTDGLRETALAPALAALDGGRYRLAVLGVGTPAGAPIPAPDGGFVTGPDGSIVLSRLASEALATLARRGGGIFQANTPHGADVEALSAWLATRAPGADATATDRVTDRWREFGPWLLIPVMGCALLAFRRGALTAVLLGLAVGPLRPAAAGWFETPDQAGQRAFTAERFGDAARQFADPAWKAAAEYRAGRYAEALAALPAADTSPTARYNQGNALARLGRFDEAIARYQEVLKADPGHADARHNLELLQELLNPPPSEQEDSPKDQEKQQDAEQQGAEDAGGEDAAQGRQGEQDSDEAGRDEQLKPPGEDKDPTRNQQARKDGERERSASERQADGSAEEQVVEDDEPAAADAKESAAGRAERQIATEQWLRQIPDDPGGLLRRKFLYQYERMKETGEETSEPW